MLSKFYHGTGTMVFYHGKNTGQNTMVAKFYHGTSTMVATMVNIQPQNTMVALPWYFLRMGVVWV